MTRILVLAAVTAAAMTLAGAVGAAVAQPDPAGPPPEGRGGRMAARPDLDSATGAKIAALRDEHRKNQIALRAKLSAAKVDFRALMRADSPDERKALAKQKEISSIRGEMAAARLSHRLAVSKLLPTDRRARMKERMGMGPEFRGGEGCCRDDDRPARRHRGMKRHRMERR